MSEHKMPSDANGTGKSRQSMQASQPVWMAHWMRPDRNAAGNRCERGKEELDCVSGGNKTKGGLKDYRPIEKSRVIETKTFEIVGSKGEENRTGCWSLMKGGKITDDKQALRQVFRRNIERDKANDWKRGAQFRFGIPAVGEASFERCNSAGEGTSKCLPEWMKTHSSAIDRSIAVLKPLHGPTIESSTHTVPYYDLKKCEFDKAQKEFDKGKTPLVMKPPIVSKDHFPISDMIMLEHENCYKHSQLADLFGERKIVRHTDTAMDLNFRDINTSLLLDTPSTSHHHLPTLGQAWFQKMQNYSSHEMFPSQGIISEKTESKKPCCNRYSLQKLPYHVPDMKTMRICATVDSVEATPEGFPRFSQTTHSVLITKDADLSKENDVFRTTNTSNDIYGQSPFSGQGKRRVDIQCLSGSSNSTGKRNIEDAAASKIMIKNESSADTDTMDMDVLKEENSNIGANHTPSMKGFERDSTLSPHVDATSRGDVRHHWTKAIPPDINLELPALPAAASSSENVHTTSSRTQSLDMDMDIIPEHSKHPKKRSNLSLGDSLETDPTMRWVKRLRLRSPISSSQCTNSSNLCKTSSPDEMKKYFQRILESGIASSEPTPRSHHIKEAFTSDKNQGLSKANRDLMADSAKNSEEPLLSQSWIKRLLRNQPKVTEKKPGTVVCEPHSFKLALDDFQNKQFPSVAAMALMGKAMNGLQSCELQKHDSFTIWNTRAF